MKRYFLQCSFWGENYSGWQKQPDMPSVQSALDKGLSTVLQEQIEVMGAGRTDTGVHAKYFIAHFDAESDLKTYKNLIYRLNNVLPNDIAVQNIFEVENDKHARFDATSREYQYRISPKKNPFEIKTAYYIKNTLDVKLMHKCAEQLCAFSNFKSFSKTKTAVNNFECNVMNANVFMEKDIVIFQISANRFLRNMVRAIAGTLINVGLGKTSFEDFIAIIESQDRRNAGKSVAAHGLYLTDIQYPYPLNPLYER
jgi:tRNA pseudouridine38-40 synthase